MCCHSHWKPYCRSQCVLGFFWFFLFLETKGRKKVFVGISQRYIFFNVAKVSVVNSEDAELWSLRKAWKKKQKCSFYFSPLSSSKAFLWTLVKLLASEKLKIAMSLTVHLCTEWLKMNQTKFHFLLFVLKQFVKS